MRTDVFPSVEIPLLFPSRSGILFLGANQQEPSKWIDRRSTRFGVNLILDGELTFIDDATRKTRLRKGDAFQRVPRFLHSTIPSEKYVECFVSVDASTMDHLAAIGCVDPSRQLLTCGNPEQAFEDFKVLHGKILSSETSWPASRLLLDAAGWFMAFMAEPQAEDQLILKAKQLLSKYLTARVKLAGAAQALGVSYDHLRTRFKRQTGKSPGKWLIEMLMERARHLLGAMTVGETARSLGYPDAFTFSRQFSKHVGLPPRNFQAKLREK